MNSPLQPPSNPTREELIAALAERDRELAQARESQTATAEVLKVISRSEFDLDTVLQTLIDTAVRLTHGSRGTIFLKRDDVLVARAFHSNVPSELRAYLAATPWRLDGDSHMARAARQRVVVHVADLSKSQIESDKQVQARASFGAGLWTPLIREGELIGVFGVPRDEPIAFTDREIELIQTFADQAVIAIENARLFDEVQAKTRDLSEALVYQTGSANILKVIASSPTDVAPALQVIVDSACEVCDARDAAVVFRDGDFARFSAHRGPIPLGIAGQPLNRGWVGGRAIIDRAPVHVTDLLLAGDEFPVGREMALWMGHRAILAMPLMREGDSLGAIVVRRNEAQPFTEKQIEVLRSFADQAVIAIGNVRLFDEVQARTRDLTEALQQQTATADVLKVISRSAFDPQAVLETLINSAVSLSESRNGVIWQFEDGAMHSRAFAQGEGRGDFVAFMRAHPQPPGRGSVAARVALTGEVQNIADVREEPDYAQDLRRIVQTRATLGVPMKRGDELLGAIVMSKPETGLYPPRIVELVKTFADQAVIAIENARLFAEVQARTRELTEALQQQTATADVLKVISRSAFGLKTVLQALVDSAVRLCASDGVIYLRHGDEFRAEAAFGAEVAGHDPRHRSPRRPGRDSVTGRVALSGHVEQIPDNLADLDFKVADAQRMKMRSLLGVPLLRDGQVEGVFVLGRPEPGAFSDRAVELVQTFADQAVIAIENVRLFEEVQSRTRELTEALERQTATAEILKVISASPTDAKPVFDAIASTAVRLFGCQMAGVFRLNGKTLTAATGAWPDRMFADDEHAPPMPLDPAANFPSRALVSGKTVLITDYSAPDVPEHERYISNRYGIASALFLPLSRGDEGIGVFLLTAGETDAFDAKDVALAESFRDQALIAVENARLFNETQEALQQQTATSDVLKVISRSAFDLEAVLDTLVSSAGKLCGADGGIIWLRQDEKLHAGATFGHAAETAAFFKANPRGIGDKSLAPRVMRSGRTEHIPDRSHDPDFSFPGLAMPESMLGVPLFRGDGIEGVFTLSRTRASAFSPRQIELVETFADQAVIAIENARLFDEVQARTRDLSESLQQQTATADVLKVISRSAFDLQVVLDTLVSSAADLIGAHSGNICVRDGDGFRYKAFKFIESERGLAEYLRTHPVVLGRGSIAGRTILSGKVEQIPDIREDADYRVPVIEHGFPPRALVGVPLHGKDGLEGVFILSRLEPGPFAPRQIEILQTFADQAVIAIENTRLFDEVQARTRELAASLDDLRKAQDRLVASEKLASLGQLTAGIAHEIKNPLNFVNNFSGLSRELLDELRELLAKAKLVDKDREEADELIGLVASNLDKVVTHGKRADSIVKNMLLHSREGSGERASIDVNAMVEEALSLAYHGARAEKPGFNVTIEKSFDPAAGEADLYPQEITRVLLNLISNGFYATTKRKQSDANGGYEPTVSASTRSLSDRVAIVITDNGTGIPEEVKAKMFNPFFTTKPAGEGTGLGLSLSYDIVVKQHGGTLDVATEPGSFTTFTIVLPRGPAPLNSRSG